MLINCTVGERGAHNKTDDELMSLIHIACIACGGHAGDLESIRYYQELAKQYHVKTAACLSYPDRENFGDVVIPISHEDLIASLEEQAAAFGTMECVKFHGALYHQLNRSAELADVIAAWLKKMGVKEVITPYRSMLHKACAQHTIPALYEAYADRSYSAMNLGLELMPRNQIGSVLENIDDVVRQVRKIKQGAVEINEQIYLMEAETVCVDSRSLQAIEIVQAILKIL